MPAILPRRNTLPKLYICITGSHNRAIQWFNKHVNDEWRACHKWQHERRPKYQSNDHRVESITLHSVNNNNQEYEVSEYGKAEADRLFEDICQHCADQLIGEPDKWDDLMGYRDEWETARDRQIMADRRSKPEQ